MATAKTRWVANDGSEFETEAEADAHDAAHAHKGRIDRFIAAREWPRGQEARARGILADFFAFEAANGITPAELQDEPERAAA